MFIWLENTQVAMWVGISLWAYPVLLAVHIVGLAIVVGIFSMRDLCLLGVYNGIRPAAFLPLSRLAWLGFLINAISGILLFTSQASIFASNLPFLIKISAILVGMVLAGLIQSRLRLELADISSVAEISNSTRGIALASLACWISAIIAGRLIAYF